MMRFGRRKGPALAACLGIVAVTAAAQDVSKLPYMNHNLPAKERAEDLVHRMTLEEKASQLRSSLMRLALRYRLSETEPASLEIKVHAL